MNETSMIKAGWNLISQRDEMWAEVIRTKYKCGRGIIPSIDDTLAWRNFWRGVCHAWKGVARNIIWKVGTGTNVNCWNDRWVPGDNILRDLTLRPLMHGEEELRVSNLISPSGGWDLMLINH